MHAGSAFPSRARLFSTIQLRLNMAQVECVGSANFWWNRFEMFSAMHEFMNNPAKCQSQISVCKYVFAFRFKMTLNTPKTIVIWARSRSIDIFNLLQRLNGNGAIAMARRLQDKTTNNAHRNDEQKHSVVLITNSQTKQSTSEWEKKKRTRDYATTQHNTHTASKCLAICRTTEQRDIIMLCSVLHRWWRICLSVRLNSLCICFSI